MRPSHPVRILLPPFRFYRNFYETLLGGVPHPMNYAFSWHDVWTHFVQIAIAFLLTAVIGWDREREAHSTGVRTFPIVGMASCGYLLVVSGGDAAAQSRVLQGLITGIGFIGGGAILKDGATV